MGDGLFGVDISKDWWGHGGPHGGYMAALMLRAFTAHVDEPERLPKSMTCHFMRPPAQGAAVIHVTTERAGRGVSFLSARLVQDNVPFITALAAYAYEREGAINYSTPAPDVPSPDEVAPPAPSKRMRTFFGQLEYRGCIGARVYSGADEALIGGWIKLSDEATVDEPALALFGDAWPASAWVRQTEPTPSPTMDMTFHFRNHIPEATTWVLSRMSSTTSAHGFFEEDGELWAPDGTLLLQTRQLALLRRPQPK
jgi:acyl-CoA thioesterase